MNLDGAVDFKFHDRVVCETLRLDHRWGTWAAEHMVMPRPKPHDFSLHGTRHYFALLNACHKDVETTADELPRSTLRDGRGKLIFIPAGCHLQGWSLPGTTPVAVTAAYLDPQICWHLDAGERQLYPMVHFEHPFLVQMMLHLGRMLAQPEMYSRIYAESFAVLLLSEIMHCQALGQSESRGERRLQAKGGLAGWQHKAVCDYIEANLHQDISLAELAAVAHLSRYHFCRAFKDSVGEPPHRYQMNRRIKRAEELLIDPSLQITDVAARVGYDSPSRFSALFRQITGYSPRAYRRMMS